MKKLSRFVALIVGLVMCFTLSACTFVNEGDTLGGGGEVETPPESVDLTEDLQEIQNNVDTDDSDVDLTVKSATDPDATFISLSQGNITATNSLGNAVSDGVNTSSDGKTVFITAEGTYVLSGTLTDGQVIVNVDKNVYIVLNGVNITSTTTSPLLIYGSKKKVVTLADNTVNTLTDASEYTITTTSDIDAELLDDTNGCLFSKKSLTINGNGSLIVNGNSNNGISCKADLKIVSGNITVTAVNNALKGKNSVQINDGTINLTSQGDGIKADEGEEEGDDENSGNVTIKGGTVTIVSDEDGIQAYSYLVIDGGTINVTTNGGYQQAIKLDETGEEISSKGIKCENILYITGGTLELNASDDTVHSDNKIIISGGTINARTGDDAIHADEYLSINDCVINITASYEGIESAKVNILGGSISVVSSDDGINAADGTETMVGVPNANCSIIISGGSVYVNASGDGIDSNGTVLISGGSVFVDGPTSGANAALDSDGGILVTGGTLIAVGAAGMVETPASNSTINCVSFASSASIKANSVIEVKDSSGETALYFTVAKQCQSVIISSDLLVSGSSYTLNCGNSQLASFTINGTITTVGYRGGIGGGTLPPNGSGFGGRR